MADIGGRRSGFLPYTPRAIAGRSTVDPEGMGRMLQAKSGSAYIAPIVQTPPDVVDRMLALADVRERDVLYDLGSGDGNIILAAARTYGIKAAGRDPRGR